MHLVPEVPVGPVAPGDIISEVLVPARFQKYLAIARKFHSKFLGTGIRVENPISNFRERECEQKILFPTFGEQEFPGDSREFPGKFHSQFSEVRMQVENSMPNFRERELEASIPGNDREREFPLNPV